MPLSSADFRAEGRNAAYVTVNHFVGRLNLPRQRVPSRLGRAAVLLVFALSVWPAGARAQDAATTTTSARQGGQGLRVFVDCAQCDFNNLRQDVTFVNYVRDQSDADVHVLITTQNTATGGREFTFEYVGLGKFTDVNQRLVYASSGSYTEDERRRGVSRTFSLGLTPYLLRTPEAGLFSLRYSGTAAGTSAAQVQSDPWDFWIFRVGSSLELNGEERQKSNRLRANVSANRTTDRWKFSVFGNGDFNTGEYILSDGRQVNSSTDSWFLSGSIVKSLGPEHWAALLRTSVSSSTQSNERLEVRQAGGIEWDYFPYSESTRRSFVIQYSLGVSNVEYYERTLYDKTEETLGDQRVAAILALRQLWGTWRASAAYSAYLHDASKYNLDFFADADVRLFRGFALNVEGSFAKVRDQLYLPAGAATDEDVLLRLRRLDTNYRYRLLVGFSYQFGSIFNNLVNPRWSAMTGRGGG